jgi:acetamidase/formamidase
LPAVGIKLDTFTTAIIGFSLNEAAFSAEIIRGGILSVSLSQAMAAAALGMSTRIIMPQAMRAILPGIANQAITRIKSTSIASVTMVNEFGNIDDWRIGKGAVMYDPVAVPGALFSVGDPHASKGDSELCGTAIECSLTGTFQLILRKRDRLAGTPLADLDYPLLETQDEWAVHGFSFANYLAEFGDNAQTEIFAKSTLGGAIRDAFRKMRHFLMATKGLSEDEAISLMSVAIDFGVTQVVDANWGVHAILKKAIFAGEAG